MPQSPITNRQCFHPESRITINRAAHTPPHRISAVPGGKVNKSSDLEYQQSPNTDCKCSNRQSPIANAAITNHQSQIENLKLEITNRQCFHRESRIAINRAAHTPPHRISAAPGGKVNKSSDLEYQKSPIANRKSQIGNHKLPMLPSRIENHN
jgi:hypothetical protein